ncbi:MAG: DUF4296 domain-containing protein [Putridiphycobacter sp.]|nr:DUF4296 domain-containing protein [Putridiphycobacter sp.]
MKRFFGILSLLMCLSCESDETTVKPLNLIPKSTLIPLMIDLEIMEAYYEQVHKRPNIYKTTLDSASRTILRNYNVTSADLEASLEYYSAMPDSIYLLYEETLDSINSMVINNKNKEI